jgi:hypothetical protein
LYRHFQRRPGRGLDANPSKPKYHVRSPTLLSSGGNSVVTTATRAAGAGESTAPDHIPDSVRRLPLEADVAKLLLELEVIEFSG